MKLKLRLTLDVEYETGGELPIWLEKQLERVVWIAAGEGLLTGDSYAEVETYDYKVETLE